MSLISGNLAGHLANSGQITPRINPAVAPATAVGRQQQKDFYTLPPVQSDIRIIDQTPQNLIKAPVGYILPDTEGNVWVKTTPATVATGWLKMTLS